MPRILNITIISLMSWPDSEEIPEDMELSLSESTEDLEDTLSMSEDDLSSDVDEECRGYKTQVPCSQPFWRQSPSQVQVYHRRTIRREQSAFHSGDWFLQRP